MTGRYYHPHDPDRPEDPSDYPEPPTIEVGTCDHCGHRIHAELVITRAGDRQEWPIDCTCNDIDAQADEAEWRERHRGATEVW